MKICENCKAENDDTLAICKGCGAVLPVTAEWAAKIAPSRAKRTAADAPKAADVPARPPSLCPALAAAAVFLVAASFALMRVNAGITLAFGGALSVFTAFRAASEGRDWAHLCSLLAAFVSVVGLLYCVVGR